MQRRRRGPLKHAPTAAARGPSLQLAEVASSGSNRRFRVELSDGPAVECVVYRGDTLCVSSQVGCGVGCPFCASGKNGLLRPLSLDELRGQLDAVEGATGQSVRRVTISGVGEPLHNARAVHAFVQECRERGVGVSLTSSGGPVDRLSEALHWPHNGLTLSIHAGLEASRARLVPRGPTLEALFGCLAAQWPFLSGRRRKKVALAYLPFEGVNDAEEELLAFAARARTLPGSRVHLYAHNPVAHSELHGVNRPRYLRLAELLRSKGLYVQLSSEARLQANGGCGTLVMLRNRARSPHLSSRDVS